MINGVTSQDMRAERGGMVGVFREILREEGKRSASLDEDNGFKPAI